MSKSEQPTCSFCGRGADDVERMLAGPGIAICDGCVLLAAEIVGEGRPEWCDALVARITATRIKSA